MSLVIDANMKMFADRFNISSSRMIQDYGLSSIDEIIEKEAARGNSKIVSNAREYYHSPGALIRLFELTNVENKFSLIHKMDEHTRELLLPKLKQEDLVMGLYFFTQEKLLNMLTNVDTGELLNVVLSKFSLEHIVTMFKEEDMANFFMNRELKKEDVLEQLKLLPHDVMQKFVESVTGMPADQTDPMSLIDSIGKLPNDKFGKFMAAIDPDVQRQLTFQLADNQPEYLELFQSGSYVNMLNTLTKPDMIKPMVLLSQETLMKMMIQLPDDMLSIVAAQIDEMDLAIFLQKGHMDLIEDAMMV